MNLKVNLDWETRSLLDSTRSTWISVQGLNVDPDDKRFGYPLKTGNLRRLLEKNPQKKNNVGG